MTKWLYIATALVLSGCCSDGLYVPNVPMAWDGLGSPPTSPRRETSKAHKTIVTRTIVSDGIADKEAELATLKIYSPEWWSVHDAIDRANDAKLAKALIICRGCLTSVSEDRTGSIAPQ